jgi:hypothetical protein
MQYRVQFTKRLCNDVGMQRDCVQGSIHVRRARTVERALQAAKKRFQRCKRTKDWRLYADAFEIALHFETPYVSSNAKVVLQKDQRL